MNFEHPSLDWEKIWLAADDMRDTAMYKPDMHSQVKHPNPEINTKWRNICSKLRNNHENSKQLRENNEKIMKKITKLMKKIHFKKHEKS